MLRVVEDESEGGEIQCVSVPVVNMNEDVVPDKGSWPSSVTYYTKRSPVGYETNSLS